MLRRAGFPVLLVALGLLSGVLVARVPPDLRRTVVTRHHHTSDPLQTAVLLRFDVDSLLHHPSRYFRPPFLYPDPNPLRGTEPLIAEALLAVPFRLALGPAPAPVFTWVRIVTLALLTVGTGLMLRELGVPPSLALLGGGLAVLVTSTAFFFDRLQAVSLQWLPLAIFFGTRLWKGGRFGDAVACGACVFLTIQASLYTTVMLASVVPFLLPLLWVHRDAAGRRRIAGLVLVTGVACVASALILLPYLRGRVDVSVYASRAFVAEKSWGAATLNALLTTPPEYEASRFPPAPSGRWDDVYPDAAVYPGGAFVLLVGVVGGLGLVDAARARRWGAPSSGSRVYEITTGVLPVVLAAFVATVAIVAGAGPTPATSLLAQALLWATLACWWLRLALWPDPQDQGQARRLLASAASFAALVLLLLSFGSPIRLTAFGTPVLEGLFGPLSSVLTPLRELRELKRFLMPAGWFAVVAFVLMAGQRLERRPRGLAVAVAAVLLTVGLGERLSADTKKVFVPPVPLGYTLLEGSTGRGGLLELPVDRWGRIRSVHRMLWQPSHGRPIVAGKTGIDPAWYTPARDVLNEFPSEECLLLMARWEIDSVLDSRRDPGPDGEGLPEGLVFRGRRVARDGSREWRLYDVVPTPRAWRAEPDPGPGEWRQPGPGDDRAAAATDGSLATAAEVTDGGELTLQVPGGGTVTALELDYGAGRFSRVPGPLRVLGRVEGDWEDLTVAGEPPDLRARAADQLLRHHSARLVVPLEASRTRQLRLVSPVVPWDLPEVRVRVVP